MGNKSRISKCKSKRRRAKKLRMTQKRYLKCETGKPTEQIRTVEEMLSNNIDTGLHIKIEDSEITTDHKEILMTYSESTSGLPLIASDSSHESTEFQSYFDQSQDDSARSWDAVDVKQTFIQESESPEENITEHSNELMVRDPLVTDATVSYPSQQLLTEDADKHFLLSLLPHLSGMTSSEKLSFQIKTLNVINEIMNARENRV